MKWGPLDSNNDNNNNDNNDIDNDDNTIYKFEYVVRFRCLVARGDAMQEAASLDDSAASSPMEAVLQCFGWGARRGSCGGAPIPSSCGAMQKACSLVSFITNLIAEVVALAPKEWRKRLSRPLAEELDGIPPKKRHRVERPVAECIRLGEEIKNIR